MHGRDGYPFIMQLQVTNSRVGHEIASPEFGPSQKLGFIMLTHIDLGTPRWSS
jgi:hypothetical protein